MNRLYYCFILITDCFRIWVLNMKMKVTVIEVHKNQSLKCEQQTLLIMYWWTLTRICKQRQTSQSTHFSYGNMCSCNMCRGGCATCAKIESRLPEHSFASGIYAVRGITLKLPVSKEY